MTRSAQGIETAYLSSLFGPVQQPSTTPHHRVESDQSDGWIRASGGYGPSMLVCPVIPVLMISRQENASIE